MATAKRRKRTNSKATAKSPPKGKTVHVRGYCRGKGRRKVSGKNQRGEDMPF